MAGEQQHVPTGKIPGCNTRVIFRVGSSTRSGRVHGPGVRAQPGAPMKSYYHERDTGPDRQPFARPRLKQY